MKMMMVFGVRIMLEPGSHQIHELLTLSQVKKWKDMCRHRYCIRMVLIQRTSAWKVKALSQKDLRRRYI